MVTLNLTINNSFFTLETLTECDSLTWAINGVTYFTSGTYYDSTLTTNNCDSVYQLDLTINTSPTIDLGADTTLICAGTTETLRRWNGLCFLLVERWFFQPNFIRHHCWNLHCYWNRCKSSKWMCRER